MGARILVADDSVTIQKVVGLTFSREDFELIQARSGEEAIRKAKETRPDLMLIDLVMPDKGGYDVCQALRADPLFRDVPIILLAGTFEAFDKKEGMRVGANDFVTKPFESQVLIGKVKQLLFARSAQGAAAVAPEAPASPAPRVEAPALATKPAPPEPAPAPAMAAPPAPPPPAPEPAPAEVISEEKLWELIDAPAAPAAAEPAMGAAPPGPSPVALPAEAPAPPAAPEAGETTVPEFSLADLEGGEGLGTLELEPIDLTPVEEGRESLAQAAASLGVEMAPPGVEAKELELEPTPLAMPEVEPPVLEIAPPAEGELPVFDLTPAMEVPAAEPPVPPVPPTMEAPPMAEAPVAQPPILEVPEEPPSVMPAAELAAPLAMEPAPAPPPAEPIVHRAVEPKLTPPAGPAPSVVEAAVREATALVAEQVARQVTDKLVERIERVVWEVVPDLAEILITREIERIKAMVEGKKIS